MAVSREVGPVRFPRDKVLQHAGVPNRQRGHDFPGLKRAAAREGSYASLRDFLLQRCPSTAVEKPAARACLAGGFCFVAGGR
jgi:hypothetical protein